MRRAFIIGKIAKQTQYVLIRQYLECMKIDGGLIKTPEDIKQFMSSAVFLSSDIKAIIQSAELLRKAVTRSQNGA